MNDKPSVEDEQIEERSDRNVWLASLFTAPVIALGSMVNLLGSAALAFPAELGSHINVVIGTLLAGSIIAAGYGALRAGLQGTLMEMQEAPAMLLGLMGLVIFSSLPENLAGSERVATVIAAFALTTVTTGIFFLVLGWARLGELVRYIPFPVIGGVLAGLGLLMMEGALSVVTGLSINGENLPRILAGDMMVRWVPAIVLAMAIAFIMSKVEHFLVIPLTLLAASGIFYVLTFSFGLGVDDLAAEGWLLGPFPEATLFQPVDYGALARVEWSMLASLVPKMASVVLIATIGLLLHASGLELAADEDIDLDRELRVCGVGNIGSGLFGGAPIFHSMANTLLARTMGAGNRITPLLVVGLWILVLIFGGAVLGYFPRPVLAALLFFLGGGLLWEWLVQGYRRLPRGDWVVVLLIVIVVAFVGYMEGIGFGVLAGVILFQIGYTKIDVVKHVLFGDSFRSNVERADNAMVALGEHGRQIIALQLQGFIFFGTANRIVVTVRKQIETMDRGTLCWLAVDFSRVGGLDWAAVNSFRKLLQVAKKEGIAVIFAVPHGQVRQTLAKARLSDDYSVAVVETLDEAMEWCEDELLAHLSIAPPDMDSDTLPQVITKMLSDDEQERLRRYLETIHYSAGDVLIRQGDHATSLFLIQRGQASVYVENDDGKTIRVKSYESGSIIGEVGLYSGTTRTATVTADTDIEAFQLTRERLDNLVAEDPELGERFDEVIIDLLGKRLASTNSLVASLLK